MKKIIAIQSNNLKTINPLTDTSLQLAIEAQKRGFKVFDATCPLVTKVHLEAIKLHSNGYHILLVGHDGHPEIEGTRGQVPKESITLIQNLKEAKTFRSKEKKLAWLSQTTLSVDDTSEIVKTLTDCRIRKLLQFTKACRSCKK